MKPNTAHWPAAWLCAVVCGLLTLFTTRLVQAGDAAERPHVVLLISEPEYQTDQTLPAFARDELQKEFQVTTVLGDSDDGNLLFGITEALEQADVLVVSVRRRAPPQEQMEAIRQFVARGKPVVGIRTANHAFSLRGQTPPEGHATWDGFDQDVFGGNYTGHHGNGPQTQVRMAPGAEQHAILEGVDVSALTGYGSLYKVSPLAEKSQPLLLGEVPNQPEEPIAWISRTSGDGRSFYTSLGHAQDFEQPAFRRLLKNALHWAVHGGDTEQR